jgi:hypothetical protein
MLPEARTGGAVARAPNEAMLCLKLMYPQQSIAQQNVALPAFCSGFLPPAAGP